MVKIMKKKNETKVLPLSDEELLQLSEDDTGIILREGVRHRVRIGYNKLPVNSSEFKDAISKELNRRILKFNHDQKDVILRFTNIRVLTPVVANLCRKINVKCVADMFIFKPKSDQILSAVVNKKSKSHIGCVMYEVFNVSIVKPSNISHTQWLGRNVEIDDKISFKVQKVDVSESIPFIVGELIADSDDSASCREIDEKDSVISLDASSSEGHFSDLDDVLETLRDSKVKKRKRSVTSSEEEIPKRRRRY